MSRIVDIRSQTRDLWEVYRRLAVAMTDDPALRHNIEHQQKMVRAWKRWADAFMAEDAAA